MPAIVGRRRLHQKTRTILFMRRAPEETDTISRHARGDQSMSVWGAWPDRKSVLMQTLIDQGSSLVPKSNRFIPLRMLSTAGS